MEDDGNGIADTNVVADAVSEAVSAVEEVVAAVPVVVEQAAKAVVNELSASWDAVHEGVRKTVATANAGEIVRIKDESVFNTVKSLLESSGNLRRLVVEHRPHLGHHSIVVHK